MPSFCCILILGAAFALEEVTILASEAPPLLSGVVRFSPEERGSRPFSCGMSVAATTFFVLDLSEI